MIHTCHAEGCNARVAPQMLMCRPHWYMVPKPIRDRIWDTYRDGQCGDKQPSAEWLEAARAAIEAVARRENRKHGTTQPK